MTTILQHVTGRNAPIPIWACLSLATIQFAAATGHASSLSASGAQAIAAMKVHFSGISTHQATVFAAVDNKTYTLKPGVDRAATITAAKQLFVGYSKAVQAARGLSTADKKTAEFKVVLKAYLDARRAIVLIGVAAPEAFLSPAGQGRWQAMDQAAKRALAYRKELKSAPKSTASERALHDMEIQLQRGIRGFSSLSQQDRGSMAGIGLIERLKAAEHFIKQTRTRWQADASTAKDVRGKCKKLQADIYVGRAASHLEVLRDLFKTGKTRMNYTMNDAGSAAWVRSVTEMKALAARLRPICDAPANQAWLSRCKPTHGKSHIDGLYADKDPVVWCEVTRDVPKLLAKWLEQSIAFNDRAQGQRYDAASLQRNKGYLSDDSLRTWDAMFTLSEARKAKRIKPYLPVYKAAGIAPGNLDRVFAGTERRLAALRQEVERLAPQWQRPPQKSRFYGVGLAKKKVKRVYGKVRIVAAGGNPQWTIKKNALGVPLHRTRGGWVLYQVAGEKLCQQRGWGIIESWDGRRYVTDDGASFGSLRFQTCAR